MHQKKLELPCLFNFRCGKLKINYSITGMILENKMSRNTICLGVVLSFLLAAPQILNAVDIDNLADQGSLRCYGGIVSTGDSDRAVLQKCGEPLEVQRIQDVGPVWIYQFGQSKYIYYMAFLHGKLQRIASAPCSSNEYGCYDLR